jgi:hypothetical protein
MSYGVKKDASQTSVKAQQPRRTRLELENATKIAGIRCSVLPEEFGVEAAVRIDADQIFLLYATFCGDIQKTAHASGATVKEVAALVARNDWDERIRGLIEIKKTDKAGEIERGISRAMNFVQAHRCRMYIEAILRDLTQRDLKEVLNLFIKDRVSKEGAVTGSELSFKPISDLTAAMEKVHWMTYQALCDSAAERVKRKEKVDDDVTETDIHARISKALSSMRAAQPLAQLRDAQEDMAAHIAATPSVTGIVDPPSASAAPAAPPPP